MRQPKIQSINLKESSWVEKPWSTAIWTRFCAFTIIISHSGEEEEWVVPRIIEKKIPQKKKKRGREIVVGRIIALKNAHVLIPRN